MANLPTSKLNNFAAIVSGACDPYSWIFPGDAMLIISQWDCGTGRTHRHEIRVVFSEKSVRGVDFIAMSRQPFGIACIAQGTHKPQHVGFWPIALFRRAAAFSRDEG